MNKLINKVMFIMMIFAAHAGLAQELPYREIPAYPQSYSGPNVAARLVDGLGFRYYWATDGLRDEDLKYEPLNAGGEARTSLETLDHIYGLSMIILNAVTHTANDMGVPRTTPAFADIRKQTLENLKRASDKLKSSSEQDLAGYKIIFRNGDKVTEYPFWNEVNGPIADAIWHVGQVVTFRRSSGNPISSKVSLLQGKVRE